MLRRLNRYKLANRTCRIVKYRNDTRYALDHVATHDLLVPNRNFPFASHVCFQDSYTKTEDATETLQNSLDVIFSLDRIIYHALGPCYTLIPFDATFIYIAPVSFSIYIGWVTNNDCDHMNFLHSTFHFAVCQQFENILQTSGLQQVLMKFMSPQPVTVYTSKRKNDSCIKFMRVARLFKNVIFLHVWWVFVPYEIGWLSKEIANACFVTDALASFFASFAPLFCFLNLCKIFAIILHTSARMVRSWCCIVLSLHCAGSRCFFKHWDCRFRRFMKLKSIGFFGFQAAGAYKFCWYCMALTCLSAICAPFPIYSLASWVREQLQLLLMKVFCRQMQEAISAVKVADVMDELSEAHVVAIDEGQFVCGTISSWARCILIRNAVKLSTP